MPVPTACKTKDFRNISEPFSPYFHHVSKCNSHFGSSFN